MMKSSDALDLSVLPSIGTLPSGRERPRFGGKRRRWVDGVRRREAEMSSSDQLPKSNPEEPSVDTPLLSGALEAAGSADGSGAQLRERVASARLRFMELTSRYLALTNRSKEAMKRSREALEQHQVDRDALCASGARYALLLRALGEPPERTL